MITGTTEKEILEIEIREHLASEKTKLMKTAYDYYRNNTDIRKKRVDVDWRTNSQIEMGLFKKLVDQKVGYLFSKEPTISIGEGSNEQETEILNDIFDEELLSTVKSLGKEAILKGVAYGFIRVYVQPVYEFQRKVFKTYVEYWDETGITDYIWKDNHLELNPVSKEKQAHFYYQNGDGGKTPYVWDKVPLIPFRYNEYEDSLLVQVKSLIDNIQLQMSTNADMLADMPKLIYVLKNYQGADLNEFMTNLNRFRSVKVASDGGVDTLQASNDTTGAEQDIARSRKFLYESARAIDTQDENLGNASGQALKWRYTDLDLDCNELENEFQKGLKQFMWFAQQYASNNGVTIDISTFSYVFNRDVISNESEAIQDCSNSIGVLDDLTVRERHPWYKPEVEERLEKQKKEQIEEYQQNSFKEVVDEDEER